MHLCGEGPLYKNSSTRHCSPRRGKIFQVLEVHQKMELIQDLSGEEEGQILAPIYIYFKFWTICLVSVYVREKGL